MDGSRTGGSRGSTVVAAQEEEAVRRGDKEVGIELACKGLRNWPGQGA